MAALRAGNASEAALRFTVGDPIMLLLIDFLGVKVCANIGKKLLLQRMLNGFTA